MALGDQRFHQRAQARTLSASAAGFVHVLLQQRGQRAGAARTAASSSASWPGA